MTTDLEKLEHSRTCKGLTDNTSWHENGRTHKWVWAIRGPRACWLVQGQDDWLWGRWVSTHRFS